MDIESMLLLLQELGVEKGVLVIVLLAVLKEVKQLYLVRLAEKDAALQEEHQKK